MGRMSQSFWLIGRMPKSLCSYEVSVIIVIGVNIIICYQFSYTHTKSKNVPSLHVVALSYNFISMKFIFACTRNLSFETFLICHI